MKLTGPNDKNLSPVERLVLSIEDNLKEAPNGQDRYPIQFEHYIKSDEREAIKKLYRGAGWGVIHHNDRANKSRTTITLIRKKYEQLV